MTGLKTSNLVFATPFNLGADHYIVANSVPSDIKAWANAVQNVGGNVSVCDETADDVQLRDIFIALT